MMQEKNHNCYGLTRGKMMTTKEVAAICRLKPNTIAKARSTGLGNYPEHVKVGRKVVYSSDDIIKWLDSNRRSTTDS